MKYKLTYEDGSTEITTTIMSEEKARDYFLPKDGSYLVSGGKIVVGIEPIA